jgi:hypothetical protein
MGQGHHGCTDGAGAHSVFAAAATIGGGGRV